jgi:hypothetical protein
VSFVEIERADFPLFNKNGDPSAKLTHAIRQLQDWKSWVKTNRNYLCRDLEKYLLSLGSLQEHEEPSFRFGFSESYYVVIGQRNVMTVDNRLLLAQMNDDLNGISVITYDMLLNRIKRLSSL